MPSPLRAALLVALAASPVGAQQVREFHLTARPGPTELEPGRTVQNGWLLNGRLPGPELRVTQGDRVRVVVRNELPEPTTLHWHGLPVPLRADGVPGISQAPIGVGQLYEYEFVAGRPGTYWYHPHVGLQTDRGLVGALIVEPRDPREDPPFDREYVVVLDDWLPGAPVGGSDPVYSDHLINGRTSLGQAPFVVRQGEVVRFRFINAGGFTNYVFTIDGHPMRVTHADGNPVVPVTTRAIPIGVGERWDVYVDANNPGKWSIAFAALDSRRTTLCRGVLAYQGANGPDPSPSYVPSDLANAPLLSYSQLAAARPIGPISANPDRRYPLTLSGNPMTYVWTISGQAYPNAQPLVVTQGESIRFDMTNRSMHWHPMHVHGHLFKVLGSAGGTTAPLVKDTVMVPRMMGQLDVEFLADNPGRWMFHCHMLQHMHAGMMREIRYEPGDVDADGMGDAQDFDPEGAWPVTWVADAGGTFRPGARVDIVGQWLAGESLTWFLGLRRTPLSLGEFGTIAIDPRFPLGTAVVGASGEAVVGLAIPNDSSLAGLELGAQAVATHPTLAPGIRASRPAWLTVRR